MRDQPARQQKRNNSEILVMSASNMGTIGPSLSDTGCPEVTYPSRIPSCQFSGEVPLRFRAACTNARRKVLLFVSKSKILYKPETRARGRCCPSLALRACVKAARVTYGHFFASKIRMG